MAPELKLEILKKLQAYATSYPRAGTRRIPYISPLSKPTLVTVKLPPAPLLWRNYS